MTKLEYTTTTTELPSHALPGDVGIDLTAISVVKKIGSRTTMYDTGICVKPQEGYYTEILPRSSIIKTGYILANSIGIVDEQFRGSLKIVLTKVDDEMPDLSLPFSVCQLIMRQTVKIDPVLVESLDDTVRGVGEFGSTN